MNRYVVELIGTFFLFLAIGAAAVLGTAETFAPLVFGTVLIAFTYAGRHVSGAHYNPAVTVALFIRGRCEGKDVAPYIAAQLVGAGIAALIVGKILDPAAPGEITQFTMEHTGAIVASELLFTFALAFVFLSVSTSRKTEGNDYYGLAIGLVVMGGALAVGKISLAAFNPAVSTGFCVTGRMGWTDMWMHLLPQVLGAVLAAFTFKGLNPEDP